MAIIRKQNGQAAFNAIFEMTGGWASVVPDESWRKPFKFMGPIEYGRKRREPQEPISIAVRVVHETPKAWLLDQRGKEFWFPKSMGDLEETDFRLATLTTSSVWLLNEKGVTYGGDAGVLPGAVRAGDGQRLHLLVHERTG